LGPDPVEAGAHADPYDAQAGEGAAQDSAAPDPDSAARDSAAHGEDSAARDSAAPHRDAVAEDAIGDRESPDALDASQADAADAPPETEAGCDPLVCMTPVCCGDTCETIHSNGAGETYYDCNPLGTYGVAAAMAACTAFANGDASRCSGGWDCHSTMDDKQVCYVDASGNCQTYCWTYSGTTAGMLSDCTCPATLLASWD
jgi:hypothetical protein